MALIKLGRYIEQSDLRNTENKYGEDSVVGISTQKEIISTKADLMGVSLTSYKLLLPNHFAYVPDTSRRGDKVSLCFNNTDNTYLVSSISIVFRVNNLEKLSSDYLYIYFNRPEFDRYARFNSWGSARETFSWEDMCDIDIELPSLPVQKKYVEVYKAMLANQRSYERGLEDLKLTCNAYIENLRREMPCEEIGKYIEDRKEKNINFKFKNVLGISKDGFIPPKQDVGDLDNYWIFKKDDFVYSPPRINIGSIGLYKKDIVSVCSPIYVVFYVKNNNKLLPEYLNIWLHRKEFFRSTNFYSLGSVRNNFSYDLMKQVKIPIPDIKIQKSIVNIYECYIERHSVNEKLKSQLKNICPILIKGSLEEAKQEEVHG